MFFLFFFFFQAEDGIRDRDVTGVQTCALPIWHGSSGHATSPRRDRAPSYAAACHRAARRDRSEERRVGKECRSWRSTGYGKKKEWKMTERGMNRKNVFMSRDSSNDI